MSDEFQRSPARLQNTEKPGERDDLGKQSREREDFEKRVRGGSAALSETARDYGQRISEAARDARDYAADKVSVVGDKYKELQNADLGELSENAREYVRQNPGKSVLIAAAAGLLLGLLISRRRW